MTLAPTMGSYEKNIFPTPHLQVFEVLGTPRRIRNGYEY
jgi:hypothetical protein